MHEDMTMKVMDRRHSYMTMPQSSRSQGCMLHKYRGPKKRQGSRRADVDILKAMLNLKHPFYCIGLFPFN